MMIDPQDFNQYGPAGIIAAGIYFGCRVLVPGLIKAAVMMTTSINDSTKRLEKALEDSDKRHNDGQAAILAYFSAQNKADDEARHHQANAVMSMAIALERNGIEVAKQDLMGMTKTTVTTMTAAPLEKQG